MKKGTKLVALLLGLALMVPACTPGANPSKSSQEPATSSEAPANYKVTISNKEELQAEWFVGDPSRKVNIEVEPKANVTQLVNDGVITITSSDPAKLSVAGQMASPVADGEVTITVACGENKDTVAVTLKKQQTVQEKYGVQHAGTEADPFDNEDACTVAKHEKYNNEDFYVKGIVSSFYYAPGSRTDGNVAFYLTPAAGKTEKFEVFKCYKDKEQKQPLTDADIWVGGEVTAHGQFTVYNNTQAETSSAIFVKCEGEPPAPRQTLTKTFAEALAAGNALADGADTYDYYKFQGYVTVKDGDNYFLTATKGEALVAGKSDAQHGEKDIKGTNAIELYSIKDAAVAAKVLKNAKIEVTMVIKNYHGTVENGLPIAEADITVLEAGEPWVINYQEKTVAEALTIINALENGKTAEGYYAVSGVVVEVTGAYNAQYGNMSFTMGDAATDTNLLTVFRLTVDAETAAKVVAGVKVTVKGQLQKYVKNDAVTPELINAKEIAIDNGQGGGGQQVTYTEVGSLSFNKDATVVINNELDAATDPKITYTSTSGVSIVNRKGTSTTNVNVWKADYSSCRWYVNAKITISHANDFDRIVFTCDSGYDAFKAENEGTAIAALKAAGITYTAEGGKITLDFASAVKTFELVPDKQIRPSNVELFKSSGGAQPAQQVIKTWTCEDLEANRSDSGWSSSKDFGGEKAFKFNKAGYVQVSYEAAAAEKVMLQLKIAVKVSNKALTGFWKQDGTEKTRITINGTAVTPGAEPDFSNVTDSGVSDSGNISIPEWFDIIEIDLAQGANTIKVEFLTGGYSYYLGGIQLVK